MRGWSRAEQGLLLLFVMLSPFQDAGLMATPMRHLGMSFAVVPLLALCGLRLLRWCLDGEARLARRLLQLVLPHLWPAEGRLRAMVVLAALAMLAASVVIYAFGLTWLSLVTGLQGQALLTAGLTPFLVGDTLKIGLAALLLPGAWALVRRR